MIKQFVKLLLVYVLLGNLTHAQRVENDSIDIAEIAIDSQACHNEKLDQVIDLSQSYHSDSYTLNLYNIKPDDVFAYNKSSIEHKDSSILIDYNRIELVKSADSISITEIYETIANSHKSRTIHSCYLPRKIITFNKGNQVIGGIEICTQCDKIYIFSNNSACLLDICTEDLSDFMEYIDTIF